MNSAFSSQILAEKLAKLNNSQQSIETLSHWCIFHRKRAKQVVETWEKLFNSSPKEQKVPFLYLANDILQNSRRKGSEFVHEFWKVLPGALRNVYESGDDHGKNVIMRLVDIWDERKVFGSRGRGLKDDILGKTPLKDDTLGKAPPSVLENNGKSPNPIKIVKKDAHSIRIKLAIGGMPEKIVTAYQSVLDGHFDEDTALNKCRTAISQVGNIEKDVGDACTQGNLQGSLLVNQLQDQESVLRQCVEQLENVEATRAALLVQLKEALQEQDTKLAAVRTQLQVARAETERANNIRKRLMSATGTNLSTNQAILHLSSETTDTVPTAPPQPPGTPQSQASQPITSFAASISAAEDEHKKAAAAVAAKLAASTSSAQMLTSVLSSLVAEEAASMNGSLSSRSFTGSPPIMPVEKRPKLEKPMSLPDMGSTYFGQMQQQQMVSLPLTLPQASSTGVQPLSQMNQPLPPFTPPPPPLPPPLPVQQFVQSSGMMAGVLPYGFGNSVLPPPPPPLPSHAAMNQARPNAPQPQPPPPPPPRPPQQQHVQPQPQPQQSATSGFYPSPGIGFYGQPQTASPVVRQ